MDGPFRTPRGPSKLSSKYKKTLASRPPDESMVLAGHLGPAPAPRRSEACRWESTRHLDRRRWKKSSPPHPWTPCQSTLNEPWLMSRTASHQPHRIPRPDFQDLDGISIFTEDQTLYHSAREEPVSSSSASDTPQNAHIFLSVGRRRSLSVQPPPPRPIWASDSDDEAVEGPDRRQSVLGCNRVILLSSDSDSDEDTPQLPPPHETDPSKERLVDQWVQTSPFHSPEPLRLSDFEADVEDESDEEALAPDQDSPLASEATSKRLSWAENCEGYPPKQDLRSFSHQTSFPTILDESSCSNTQSGSDPDWTGNRVSKALQVSLTTEDDEPDPEVTEDTVILEPSLLGTEPLHLHLTLSTQCSTTPPAPEKSLEQSRESSSPEEETRFQQFLQKLKRDREERALREVNSRRPIEDFLVNDSDEEALMPVGSPPKARYFQEPIALSSSEEHSESSRFESKNWNRKSTPKNRVLSDSEETNESYRSILKTVSPRERNGTRSMESPAKDSVTSIVVISDSDEDDKENELPDIPLPKRKPKTTVKPKKPTRTVKTSDPAFEPNRLNHNSTLSFMESLSLPYATERCHPDATKYLTKFQTHRDELARKLYKLFNEQIFAMSLPTDMELMWSPRLRKTAGRCWQKSRLIRGDLHRFSSIELSSKVLDSSDRLRDTLIHEMCHAAAWIISGYRDGHGPIWKDWAKRSMREFPELPIINRCHNYAIRTKFTYRCVKCGYQLGRHSKSLDTERKVCGLCRGQFELLVNRKAGPNTETPGRRVEPTTPRTPNKFALFVKENYKHVRVPGVDHKDAMKMLSSRFAQTKIS